jgi:signal transduction histidine kinase/ABC-type uncharacterized transport system substrate-binding protein
MVTLLTLLGWVMPGACGPAEIPAANVLVVYSQSRLLPATLEFDRGLYEASAGGATRDVRFFTEFLGSPEFEGEVYEARTAAYLKGKYAGRPPQVIVGGGGAALAFLLRHRAAMFPGVPIVYGGVDRRLVKTLALPADVMGIPVDYDIRGTLELALRLQPNARRLVVVTGASRWDHDRQTDIRAVLEDLRLGLPVEYLAGLPQSDIAGRLATLTRDAIVFTPGYFLDNAGRRTTPRESVMRMAGAAGAPIYVLYATEIGTGAVGGRMATYVDMGRETRIIIDHLLDGDPVASIAVPSAIPLRIHVDWRQVRKWDIPADLIAPDAVIHFREPTFWELYRARAILAGVVILLQAGLIIALLVERRRRRRMAAALTESEQRIALAARAARLSTFGWSLAPLQSAANGGLRGLAGRAEQTAENLEHVLQNVHPEDRDRVEAAAHRAAANKTELDVEYRTLQPDGEIRWYAARGYPAAGTSDRLTGMQMDITARKTSELQAEADRAALTHMSRVSTMGQLCAAVAHQLNQPLAAILGNAETARKILGRNDGSSLEDVREILDDIVAEDNRATGIIRRLGALYKRGEIELSGLDLNDVVRETLELLRVELTLRKVTLVLELAPSLPRVQGSRVHLQQMLLNLILNAADAMSAVDPSRRRVIVRTSSDGEQARVCVVDHGHGIAAADLPRLFDAFWTTKATGLGVGLAICKAIINAHRGTLTVENNPDGGAAFCFTVPAAVSG